MRIDRKQCEDFGLGYEDSLKQEESATSTNQNFRLCALHSSPSGVTNPPIPFSNPNPEEERPFEPCKVPAQNKTPSATEKNELTLVEEVEEYLRMEAIKEKASRSKKIAHPAHPSFPPSLYLISHP